MKKTTYKKTPELCARLHLKFLRDRAKNNTSNFNTLLMALFIGSLFFLGSLSVRAQCAGTQTVYTLSPSATQAANTISPNGGTVNLVYTITSGPTIAGLASSFTVPMTYSDLNNTATGVDNRWEGFGILNSSVYTGSYLSILPITNGAATGSIFANLPTNNRQQELWSNPNNTDNLFTTRIAGGALDLLGNFSLTIGNYPTFPAGVGIVADELTTMSAGNMTTIGNSHNQAGYWMKPITQTELHNGPQAVTVPMAIELGTTVNFKYSAFSNGTDYVLNTGTRGVGIAGSVTLCSLASADLAVTKTANNPTPQIGQNVTFTITASNAGPNAATGVVVNDQIPAGYTLVSATPSTGTWTAPNWTIGNLANGANATLTVVATVNATGSYANTATITGTEPDPNPGNNTDTETPVPTPAPAPSIALIKAGVLSSNGNTITYTFTVKNTGNVTLNPVTVTDAKLTPNNVTLAATTLAPGAETTGTATYTVTAAEKTAGQVQNTATATGTPPTGNPVTDVSGTTFEDNTPTVIPVPGADLAVTKTASNLTPSIGSQVTFTITASNAGPSAATGVVVNDQIPAGYTLVSATPSTGTWTAPNWAIGNLANGANAILTVVATVNATGPYANTATITGTELDPNPGNNTDTETPTPTPAAAPAIALVKTGVLSTDGNTITYNFTVTNTGNVSLNPVVVNDPKLTPSNVTLLATTLAPGAETTGTATYTVTAAEKTAGQVENTATATGTPPTGNPVTDVSGTTFEDNNPTVIPVPGADLVVTKTASNLTPALGSQVTFTITASNNGPSAATGVVVNDPLPAGYTLVSATPSTGTWTAPNWTIGNLANGANATLTVVATVNATGPYANTATITGTEPDPNPGNNTDTETPTPPAAAPAIALVKTGVLSANGNTITYSFTVKNTGNVTLNPVVVNDPKLTPSNVTLLATTLAPGAETTGTATYTVTAAEKTAGQVQNTATATGTPPTGSPVTDVSGTTFENNNPTVVPIPGADLELTKVVSEEYPSVGGQVTFTVTAKNNGPSNATGVVVTDALPSGYVLLNATPSTGVWSAPNWSIGNLANGASASMTIVATVAGTGNHENVASVTGNQPDPTPGNNTDSATTYPGSGSDLEVTKTPNNFTPNVGDQITFTITAKNNGPRTATGVTVTDALPSGYTFISATPSQGVWSAPVWSVGTLASGASVSMTVVATVGSKGVYRNTAIVAGVEPDPNPLNDTASVVPSPGSITDLEVIKTVNNAMPNIGEQVTFTIQAKNNGPRNATGVVVNDVLPSGYTYVSHTTSIGTWSAPNWSVGNLANGANATLTIVATVNATGVYANKASIEGEQPDDKPENNEDTAVTSPGSGTDLAVEKTVDIANPSVGQSVTFTITAKNNGPRNATGVVVTDQIPSGFVVINVTPSVGTWSAPNWTIGNLSNGASATLTVVATVNASGNYTNVAGIDGNEPDPDPSNNEDEATTPTPENVADLQVTKVADNMTPAIGSQVTFTITAKNNGPKNATGVVVNDMIPAGYVVLSATPSVGNWSAPNWSIGNLANGASQTLTIVAVVNATGSYANTATITGNQLDPNPNNNTSTVTPTPPASSPGIALVKTGVVSTDGNTITYSFTVTNTGNVPLTGVTVNDPKLTPSSVTLASTTLAVGQSTTGAGIYTVTTGDRTTGSVTNTATATGNPPTGAPVTDISGTTQTNDTPTVVVIPQAPGIALVKTGVLSTDGNTITYSFTVTNTGDVPLTDVTVNDPKLTPTSVTLLATTLAPGASTTGTGTYTVTAGDRTVGSVTNTATATGNPPTGAPVTDVSGTTQTNDTPTVVPIGCVPDLNPAITVTPNNGIVGQVRMAVILDIKELLGCDTDPSKQIRVTVPKTPYFSFTWSTYATATSLPDFGYSGLENADWSFSENLSSYIWTYNKGMFTGNDISSIGFEGTWNAGTTAGTTNFTVTIVNGSGGEINTLNNVDYAKVRNTTNN